MRLGVDLDGVLCDFNTAFIALIQEKLGMDLPKPSSSYPNTWDYHKAAGITSKQNAVLWKHIQSTPFMASLNPLPGAVNAIRILRELDDNVYFITSRRGPMAKYWSEVWLKNHGAYNPTVIQALGSKGDIAKGLKLDVFIDDKPGYVQEVIDSVPKVRAYLIDAPYNQDDGPVHGIRVKNVLEVLTLEGLVQAVEKVAA
jgi:uncharacterized HAD superfamily protein